MTAKTEKSAPSLSSLTGPEKVAVLLLALGQGQGGAHPEAVRRGRAELITRSAADLTTITAADLDALVEEFAKKFATGIKFIGTAKELENLLVAVMTEDEIAEVKSGGERTKEEPVWDIVSRLKEDVLRACLQKEHPQTAALILSRIDSGTAAKIVGGLSGPQRNDLLCRMLVMGAVSDQAVTIVEDMLREELSACKAPPPRTRTPTSPTS